MRVFAVYNPLKRKRRAAAWALIEPSSNTYTIEIADWARPEDLPLELALIAEGDLLSFGGLWARRWVESRIPPSDRENVEQMLNAAGTDEYYIPEILAKTKGRSSRDDFLLEEVPQRNYKTYNLNAALGASASLATQLSRARRAAGLTQAQLAEECGIQQAVVSRIESGKGNPTLETLEILARGCGRTLHLELR